MMGVGCGLSTPRTGFFTPEIECTGGWVGPRADVDGCEEKKIICHQHQDSNPEPSSP